MLTLIWTGPYAHVTDVERLTEVAADLALKPAAQVLVRRMPGGAVLVHLPSNRIFELNETGTRVWELLSEGLDRQQVLRRLVREFDVDAGTAAGNLDAILEHLEREGLLTTI